MPTIGVDLISIAGEGGAKLSKGSIKPPRSVNIFYTSSRVLVKQISSRIKVRSILEFKSHQ